MKKIIFLIFLFSFIFIQPVFSQGQFDESVLPSEIGKVLSVETFGKEKFSADGELNQTRQSVEVLVIKGAHKGQKVIIDNMLMGNPAYDILLKNGDKVVLHVEQSKTNDGGIDFFIADKYRANVLISLGWIFCLLLIAVGMKKGFFSLVSIVVTLGLIFYVLTPLILHGVMPILATVLVCVLASVIAIYLVGGVNAKSSSAILGIILSLIIAGVMSLLTIKFAGLTGFSSEENLFLFGAHPNLNFTGVLASSMLIGALGAVMDIGMSISSTINEIYLSNLKMTVKELFLSGMNVGKDIIGTMANTLILAYLGGSLALVLLSDTIDMQKFFNLNQVATEIASALIGSISIVLCVPVTAVISAYMTKKFTVEQVTENNFSDIMHDE